MYKKITIACLISLLIISCKEQPKNEIAFKNSPFSSLLKRAKNENKLIFIDCYTSWCAPCKWMDKYVFTEKKVFDFYNSNFINLKLDMEKGEGIALAKKYQVKSFPTYLFIDSEGNVVHRANSRMSAEAFIAEGKKALDPSKSTGILAKKYKNNSISLHELVSYAIALKENRNSNYEKALSDIIAKATPEFYPSEDGWLTVQHFLFDKPILSKQLDEHKAYYIKNYTSEAVNKLYKSQLQRQLYSYSRNKDSINFFKAFAAYKLLNPSVRDLAIMHSGFYVKTDNSKDFISTTNSYLSDLDDDPETIAFIARSASNSSKNKKILEQTGKLISIAYTKKPLSYGTVSTYASIQSKLGAKQKAILAGELAVKMADTISSKIKKLALKNLEKIKSQ